MVSEDKEIIDMFTEESLEHLSEIETILLDIEQAGANAPADLVNKVFRAAHSIKGGAACLGFEKVKELAHKIENILHLIRNREIIPESGIVNHLLISFDALKNMINNLGGSESEDISEYIKTLTDLTTSNIPETSRECVEKRVEVTLPGGNAIFSIPEFDLMMAEKGGNFVYLIEYDLIKDIHRKGKVPLDIIRRLQKSGNILASKADIAAVGTLNDDFVGNTIPFYLLFSTIIDPEYISSLCGVDAAKIGNIRISDLISGRESSAARRGGKAGEMPIQESSSAERKLLYHIYFRPEEQVFLTGLDISALLEELGCLGKIRTVPDTGAVPALEGLAPNNCYLSWNILLVTGRDENEIKDVFIFLKEEAVVSIRVCSVLSDADEEYILDKCTDVFAYGWELSSELVEEIISASPAGVDVSPGGQTPERPSGGTVSTTADAADDSADSSAVDASFADSPVPAAPPLREASPLNENVSQPQVHPAQPSSPHPVAERIEERPGSKKSVEPVHAEGAKRDFQARGASADADSGTSSIRVPAERLDKLVDLVGELVIVQARLSQSLAERNLDALYSVAEEFERLSNELRDSTLNIRMLPFGTTFTKFRRLVRDLSTKLGKEIELVTGGAETELDKTVIERLNDPLVHIIRNSIDHGVESPEERAAQGKPSKGTINLFAEHSGGEVHIKISDDGKGIDPAAIKAKAVEKGLINADAELGENDIYSLIFAPGFSTAKNVSDVSGRGVGMDVVKRNIDALRGRIEFKSRKGEGTSITIVLPLTLAIIDGLLVRVGGEFYVIPLATVEECVELVHEEKTAETQRIINLRGEIVPYVRLNEWFEIGDVVPEIEQIVITRSESYRTGIVVDEVVGRHQTVIKGLGRLYRDVDGISGATIKGDGSIALIIDVPHLVRSVMEQYMERA